MIQLTHLFLVSQRNHQSSVQRQMMNLEAGKTKPVKQRRQMVTTLSEHHFLGFHLISTLELFILFTVCGSFVRSKLAPFILNSWIHLPSALLSLLSLCNCPKTLKYLKTFHCTRDTITREVKRERKDGTHHFRQAPSSLWIEEVKRRVRWNPWNAKKKQHNWKTSRLMLSNRASLRAIRWPKRSSSLCQSLRSKRWPGLWEISINGWWWIREALLGMDWFCCWCSWSTGISTTWASLYSAMNEN